MLGFNMITLLHHSAIATTTSTSTAMANDRKRSNITSEQFGWSLRENAEDWEVGRSLLKC